MSYASPAFMPRGEGFVSHMAKKNDGFKAEIVKQGFLGGEPYGMKGSRMQGMPSVNVPSIQVPRVPNMPPVRVPSIPVQRIPVAKERFQNYSGNPAGARDSYQAIGAFDGVKLDTGNSVSNWRYTKPNEPLNGYFPKFEPGPDNLFMFKDNQCKPECCGASYSCDGGCVCTTPEQRDFINQRGGNRTSPESGV
uniref:Uncharacterized protein n=1 Tax=viral metagenome TaxID=1070528 RepID=A0A6C0KPS8_9ZZZZ